uniref:DUF834 domain-containing protein n=1 Tax=Oryza glumipatula TaxID=40148 RepID=A0A0E0BIC9_9ORYZ
MEDRREAWSWSTGIDGGVAAEDVRATVDGDRRRGRRRCEAGDGGRRVGNREGRRAIGIGGAAEQIKGRRGAWRSAARLRRVTGVTGEREEVTGEREGGEANLRARESRRAAVGTMGDGGSKQWAAAASSGGSECGGATGWPLVLRRRRGGSVAAAGGLGGATKAATLGLGEMAAAHMVLLTAAAAPIAGGRRDVVRTWASWANWADGKMEKEWAK